jgi:uncharacterized protein (UPF0335 family)
MSHTYESPTPTASAGASESGLAKGHLSDNPTEPRGQLQSHFDRALDLLHQKADVANDFAEWRREARDAGLVPGILIRLARQNLRDDERRRKDAEQAEIEELYRRGLGLPLFDHADGRAAE